MGSCDWEEFGVTSRYPCPCCGRQVFDERPGSDDICPFCWWQDDFFALLSPFELQGPNKVSLFEGQANCLSHGVSQLRFVGKEQPEEANYPRDPGWRPINRQWDVFENGETYPEDETHAYYWRPNYWLSVKQRH